MNLQLYERLKFDLADILRAATAGATITNARRQETIRSLFGRLAEDRFNLVVIGRFSRGKTSLMNAILGMDRLPTGVIPLTSVITTVTYGSDERVVLHFRNTSLFMDIPLAQLAANITERGNRGNVKGINTAEVQLPAEILRSGFHFIDTPGLGSSIIENTRTTEAFLPEADAFILVTSYDSPLSEEELRTLKTVHGSGRRCFVVLNKQDCVSLPEREEVRIHVEAQLSDTFGGIVPELYSVSARQGLAARCKGDAAALADSGLPTFEDALIAFLLTGKRREFLLNMCTRVEDIADVNNGMPSLAGPLNELRRQISGTIAETGERSEPVHGLATATLTDCEVCRVVSDKVFDFLAHYQRLLRNDVTAQANLAAAGGLCGGHMEQFRALAAPKEICTGFAPVLERQAQRLLEAANRAGSPDALHDAIIRSLPTAAQCPACEIARSAAAHATADIAAHQRQPGAVDLKLHSVLCLPHLAGLLRDLPEQLGVQLLKRQAVILGRLADDMRRFALKHEGAKRYLASREELAAGRRGLRALLEDPNAVADPHLP